jgi:hypothetical protein
LREIPSSARLAGKEQILRQNAEYQGISTTLSLRPMAMIKVKTFKETTPDAKRGEPEFICEAAICLYEIWTRRIFDGCGNTGKYEMAFVLLSQPRDNDGRDHVRSGSDG